MSALIYRLLVVIEEIASSSAFGVLLAMTLEDGERYSRVQALTPRVSLRAPRKRGEAISGRRLTNKKTKSATKAISLLVSLKRRRAPKKQSCCRY